MSTQFDEPYTAEEFDAMLACGSMETDARVTARVARLKCQLRVAMQMAASKSQSFFCIREAHDDVHAAYRIVAAYMLARGFTSTRAPSTGLSFIWAFTRKAASE